MPFQPCCLQDLIFGVQILAPPVLLYFHPTLFSYFMETPQCPDPYFLLVCLIPFGLISSLEHIIIHLNPLSTSPSTFVFLPHLSGIITIQLNLCYLPSLFCHHQRKLSLDRLVSPIHGFEFQMHFPSFFIILLLVSGQLLLLFSITVPIFTIFPNPTIDLSSPHSWTFRTISSFSL